MPDDTFTDILTPVPAPPARPPARPSGHRVLWFAVGAGLFTIDASLLLVLAWMLLHL